jgi:hypothetical protein
MNKKMVLMTFIGMAFSVLSFCQTSTAVVNPNAEHDRMYRLVLQSEKNETPSFVVDALKAFAKEKGYEEKSVLRNAIIFKPLYNKNVSKEDKLFVTKILMKMCENPQTTIPVNLVAKAINDISKN